MAFSSSTGIAECLIIVRKLRQGESPSTHGQLVSLRRPQTFPESTLVAQKILAKTRCYKLEDGPIGGALLTVGQQALGEAIAALDEVGRGCVRVLDYSLPQISCALTQPQLWLPGEANPLPLSMVALGDIGEMGYYHLQIISGPPNEASFYKTAPSDTSTYPALWNHHAELETQMICQPDCQLEVRIGMEKKASKIWKTAGRAHTNRDFGLGSQPLAVALTKRKNNWRHRLAKCELS